MTKAQPYKSYQCASAIFMILALLWLTISTPFVLESQKIMADKSDCRSSQSPFAGTEEESNTPAGNATEEKVPKTLNSITEEYLHDNNKSNHLTSLSLQYFKHQDAGIYVAYHGEPLVPPPNAA